MAKEFFEKRRLVGKLNVACKFDDGSVRHWNADKAEVIQQVCEIVDYYQGLGYKLTLRQLHYQFVSRNWIVNHDTAYKKLGKILDDCRYAGLVDWSAIEDRGRSPWLPYWAHDVKDALEDTLKRFRINRQHRQETCVEVWTEKDALSGIMRRSTSKFGVNLIVNKGYTSSSAMHDAYKRFTDWLDAGQNVTILYFGDHDPSGLDMVRDIQERLRFMFIRGDELVNKANVVNFRVIPIGLTMKQIKQYKCPPNPTKLTDSRAAGYIEEHGATCWEVDALNPEVLTEVLETNIVKVIDVDIFDEEMERERTETKKLKTIISKIK